MKTVGGKELLDKELNDKPKHEDYRNERISGKKFKNPASIHEVIIPGLYKKHLPYSLLWNSRRLGEATHLAISVGRYFDIGKQELFSKSRKREIVIARQTGMYIINKKYGKKMSVTSVGDIYDKDHATVLHAIKTINNLMETDRRFITMIKEIEVMYC